MFVRVLFAFCAALIFAPQISSAKDGSDFVTVPYYINPVSQPKNIREIVRECVYENEDCNAIVNAAGAVFGIPPGSIEETMRFYDDIGLGVDVVRAGEEGHYLLKAGRGMTICKVRVEPISAAPAGGRHSPTFSTTIVPHEMRITTFVHRIPGTILEPFPGRSWLDVSIIIVFIKREPTPADGCIFPKGYREIRHICRGRDGFGGHPGCTPRIHSIAPK